MRGKPLSFSHGTRRKRSPPEAARARHLQCFAPQSRSQGAAGARIRQPVAGSGNLQFREAQLRPLVFLAQGCRRAGSLRHVPPAKYVVCLHRKGRPKSAGAGPHRVVRAARRVPAHRRPYGGRRARRPETAVRGIERQTRARGPVRGRAQASLAEPAPTHRHHHLTDRRRGAGHSARAGAALSRGSGLGLPRVRSGRSSGGGDRRGA